MIFRFSTVKKPMPQMRIRLFSFLSFVLWPTYKCTKVHQLTVYHTGPSLNIYKVNKIK